MRPSSLVLVAEPDPIGSILFNAFGVISVPGLNGKGSALKVMPLPLKIINVPLLTIPRLPTMEPKEVLATCGGSTLVFHQGVMSIMEEVIIVMAALISATIVRRRLEGSPLFKAPFSLAKFIMTIADLVYIRHGHSTEVFSSTIRKSHTSRCLLHASYLDHL
ncbi:predicted protein [Sclerotinia sclerotiorum 1980 UF-70]|uniref:Uncharacterized protein n=1 Tax=Sclerotinia sclerotiorum (strain ATCC 18683 / 1980 / Ss-1) TaxID=665079 RepID=A7ENX1_SCLS1|nr:predicted protein [Sclerotinia sclerotiorum 1980 UF-70]EDO04537.1 predicted protein [Sclerotinia sclerotiorum 1980 UF-70]